jgi:replicative DNA helicase
MSTDIAFICRLLCERGFGVLSNYSLSKDMLVEDPDKCQSALEFIQVFFTTHGKMPEIETLESNLGVAFRVVAPEPITYYAEKLRDRWLMNVLLGHQEGFHQKMNAMDFKGALACLESAVSKAKAKYTGSAETGLADLRTTTADRFKEYQRIANLGGAIDGIPFPWPALNEATMGLHPGELWFIVARMKTGKSWSEVCLADHFFRNGKTVLFVTMEMPIGKISRRLDSMYSHLPYGDFKRGKLDTLLVEKYAKDLELWKDPSNPPFWVCGKGRVKTPHDLDLLVGELKPDVVLVDGMYLMKVTGQKSSSKWEKVAAVADELQELAQVRMVPVVATTQFNRKVKKETLDAGAEELGFAYEIGQNADGLIGMFQNDNLRNANKMWLKLVEHRERACCYRGFLEF